MTAIELFIRANEIILIGASIILGVYFLGIMLVVISNLPLIYRLLMMNCVIWTMAWSQFYMS